MTIKRLDKKARKEAKKARDNRKGQRDNKRTYSLLTLAS